MDYGRADWGCNLVRRDSWVEWGQDFWCEDKEMTGLTELFLEGDVDAEGNCQSCQHDEAGWEEIGWLCEPV